MSLSGHTTGGGSPTRSPSPSLQQQPGRLGAGKGLPKAVPVVSKEMILGVSKPVYMAMVYVIQVRDVRGAQRLQDP